MNSLLFSDLRRFKAGPDRKAAWRRATSESGLNRYSWLAFPALVGLHAAVVLWSAGLDIPEPSRRIIRIVSILAVAGAAFGLFLVFRRFIQRSLRRQLNENGVPTCVACGYDLSHLEPDRCPECGSAVQTPR